MFEAPFDTIRWDDDTDCCVLIDQTLLPRDAVYVSIHTAEAMWEAIKLLRVRGAPAIGIAGAYGLYLGIRAAAADPAIAADAFLAHCRERAAYLSGSRPTAVNLDWALRRLLRHAESTLAAGADPAAAARALLAEAKLIHEEDTEVCRRLGEVGEPLVADGATLLTHCNAGGLATSRFGTALAPMLAAKAAGKKIAVFADETRPLLQGARLTSWELQQAGIPVTVICDNMAASIMAQGRIHAVIVGTDRVAANGDVANKIGTYGVALAAHAHDIPFYVAAPLSSIDMSLDSGADIPIEERAAEEITEGLGRRITPDGVAVYNPAFDITPARLVTALITERGLVRPPFAEGLRALFASGSI